MYNLTDRELSKLKFQFDELLKKLGSTIYTKIDELEILAWITKEPVSFQDRINGNKMELKIGNKWGNLFDCGWFRFQGKISKEISIESLVALIDISGEICIVDKNGSPIRGLTNVSSEFDRNLGEPGKRAFPLKELYTESNDHQIEFWGDAGCNDLFGYLQDDGKIKEAAIAIFHPEFQTLYFDFEILIDSIFHQNDTSKDLDLKIMINEFEKILNKTKLTKIDIIELRNLILQITSKLKRQMNLEVSAIGHAHMDLAWLWPIRETKRKGARTFATALAEIRRYSSYIYGASQPQLYQWMKEDYPKLYDRIKEQVNNNRIEPLGAMWVESDVNLIGGESLIRQILYGKNFFKTEFGIDVDFVWLPDSFGFPASLPQIFKSAGLKYFITQKLSWNTVNKFPYNSFIWVGIDGSSILAHLLPENTYNSPALPRSLIKIEKNYNEKDLSNHALMVYGIGDGGGGPGVEHLERIDRLSKIDGYNKIKQEKVKSFLNVWSQDANRFPKWVGELYLERHQGTYTTNAKNKWYNRRIEILLHDWEILLSLANIVTNLSYPKEKLDKIWKEVLLYQFHDILPGSSIKRVYKESTVRYKELYDILTLEITNVLGEFSKKLKITNTFNPVFVFNSLPWKRMDWIKIENSWYKLSISSLGYQILDSSKISQETYELSVKPNLLENNKLRINFDEDGNIISIYDKELKIEIIESGQKANLLGVYVDMGDAWDLDANYLADKPKKLKLESVETLLDGPKAILKHNFVFSNSYLIQEIILTENNKLIEFNTKVSWKEIYSMLRVSFPVTVHSNEAFYDIQFGFYSRPTHSNTSWDSAKIEVVGHKWVDLSQYNFGVALLNDSKYGHRIKGNIIDLNLIRSAPYPGSLMNYDENEESLNVIYTDQGDHEFRYALYPHTGNHITGGVIRMGYEFNYPLYHIVTDSHEGIEIKNKSFIDIKSENVILETMKLAEDGNGIVIRLYETFSSSCQVEITTNFEIKKVIEVNSMEEIITEIKFIKNKSNSFELNFRPLEIKTIKLM